MTPLRQRMLDDMSIRNFAENTQLSYVQQIGCFARYFGRSPEQLGPEQVRIYQSHLVKDRHLSASSVGTATAALRFLYRVTRAAMFLAARRSSLHAISPIAIQLDCRLPGLPPRRCA